MKAIVRLLFLAGFVSLIVIHSVKAEWIEIPLVNPGAELGDMTRANAFNL